MLNIVSGIKEHGFNSFEEANVWAKENIVRTLTNEETGGKGEIRISNNAISKFLSESAVAKSDNKDVHLSVLRVLPNVIKESVDAEQHPDYKKGEDGNRSAENGINENVTIHRLYGAVDIDGKLYRVKVTIKEDRTNKDSKTTYSYEATKIELLAGQHEEAVTPSRNSNNSITGAKLLENIESAKEKGKKLLDYSQVVDENGEPLVVYHGSGDTITKFVPQERGERYWFSSNKEVAESYTPFYNDVVFEEYKREYVDVKYKDGHTERQYYDLGGVHHTYLNVRNPLEIDCNGENWDNIKFEGKIVSTEYLSDYAFENGYDGTIFRNVIDGAFFGIAPSDVYVTFKSSQIKSATDNNGNFYAHFMDLLLGLK